MPKKPTYYPKEQTPVDYFYMIPNVIDDLSLSPATYRIYCHLKRVAGEKGELWQTTEQIAKHCKVSKSTVVQAKRELEYLGLIEIHINTSISSHKHYIQLVDIWKKNHDHFASAVLGSTTAAVQPEASAVLDGTAEGGDGGTGSLLTKNTPQKEERPLEENNIYIDILGFWNSQDIIHHRILGDSMKSAIKTSLKENTVFEICEAIKTYAEILHGDYRWDYTWTLGDFLRRGLGKFLNADIARKNYRIKNPEATDQRPESNPEEFHKRYGHLIKGSS